MSLLLFIFETIFRFKLCVTMHILYFVCAARERNENVFQSQRRRLHVTTALEVKKSM